MPTTDPTWPVCPSCEHHARVYSDAANQAHRCGDCGHQWYERPPAGSDAERDAARYVVRPVLDYHLWATRVSAGHDEARAVHGVMRLAEQMAGKRSREDVACCLLSVAVAMLARDHDEPEVAHALAVALDLECRDAAHQRARETAAACLAAVMEAGR